jgi:hypothetical protein
MSTFSNMRPGTRNGTIRNTDSFFKDDTAEPRKISLTPKLLSEETSSLAPTETDSKGRGSSSFDLDRKDKFKEEKKKEKKGVLSIFKRKSKDKKKNFDTESITSKNSMELARESPPLEKNPQQGTVQRKLSKTTNKLQKTPSGNLRNITSPSGPPPSQSLALEKPLEVSAFDSASTSRAESPERPAHLSNGARSINNIVSPVQAIAPQSILTKPGLHNSHTTDPINRLSESPVHVTMADAEPPALVRDNSSDSDDLRSYQDTPSPQIPSKATLQPNTEHMSSELHHGSSPTTQTAGPLGLKSPPYPTRSPPLQPTTAPLNIVTPSSIQTDRQGSTSTTASAVPSTAPSTPVWSDASLRQYLEESGTADIRDLLILTRDTTGIVPVGNDHPLMLGLYTEERTRVKDLGSTLDGLLGTWLEKRMRGKTPPMSYKMGSGKPI